MESGFASVKMCELGMRLVFENLLSRRTAIILLVLLIAIHFLVYEVAADKGKQTAEPILVATVWRSDGAVLAAATRDEVWLYAASGEPLIELAVEPGISIVYMAWHRVDNRLAIAGSSRVLGAYIYVWNVSGTPPNINVSTEQIITTEALGLGGITWSSDARFALAYGPTEISIWDAASGSLAQRINPNGNVAVDAIAWSPDGRRLAAGVPDDVRVFDTQNYQEITTLNSQTIAGYPNALVWSPDSDQLAVGEGASVVIWNYDTSTDVYDQVTILTESPGQILWLDWQSHTLAAAAEDNMIRIWNTDTWEMTGTISNEGDLRSAFGFSLSPDGTKLVYSNANGRPN